MPLTKIEANDFTVFENIEIPFNKGLNVLVGENGMGKTYIMKLAYAACQASKHDVSFSQKTTMLFRPDQSSMYDVQDYDDPEDFYYDHIDEFDDIQDAEDYWEESFE